VSASTRARTPLVPKPTPPAASREIGSFISHAPRRAARAYSYLYW
jgi:hypothetical protein